MKKILFLFLIQISLLAADTQFYAGPHFNYTRLRFDTPFELEGYMGGAAAGAEYQYNCLFTSAEVEGYWNAGPITGRPCQRSSLTEFFAQWKLGGNFFRGYGCLNIKPYTGIGYNRFENEQAPEGISLKYEYEKIFVPAGVYTYWWLSPCIKVGAQFEWRFDVESCLDVASLHFNNKLEHGYRAQLPLDASLRYGRCCFNLSVIPFFDWNRFGRVDDSSPNDVPIDIPELTRWNAGLRVLFGCYY